MGYGDWVGSKLMVGEPLGMEGNTLGSKLIVGISLEAVGLFDTSG